MATEATKVNPIVDFFKAGKDFLSEEGMQLIAETDEKVIHEAAYGEGNDEILTSLLNATNNTSDVYFRRKIFKAL